MSKKIYVISINPLGIGDRFDMEMEMHENDPVQAMDCLIREQHITGMMLADIRQLLARCPEARMVSIGNGISVEGLPQQAIEQAVEDGLIEEALIEDHDKPRPKLSLVPALTPDDIPTPAHGTHVAPVAILFQHHHDDEPPRSA